MVMVADGRVCGRRGHLYPAGVDSGGIALAVVMFGDSATERWRV